MKQLPERINFGQYKGQYYNELPESYLTWVISNVASPLIRLKCKNELAWRAWSAEKKYKFKSPNKPSKLQRSKKSHK
jgi:hypothetical protein